MKRLTTVLLLFSTNNTAPFKYLNKYKYITGVLYAIEVMQNNFAI